MTDTLPPPCVLGDPSSGTVYACTYCIRDEAGKDRKKYCLLLPNPNPGKATCPVHGEVPFPDPDYHR